MFKLLVSVCLCIYIAQKRNLVWTVTCVVGSRFLSSAKKEFRAQNSNAGGSLFSMQNNSPVEEKIQAGHSECCLGLLERKSQRQKSERLDCVDSGKKSQRKEGH